MKKLLFISIFILPVICFGQNYVGFPKGQLSAITPLQGQIGYDTPSHKFAFGTVSGWKYTLNVNDSIGTSIPIINKKIYIDGIKFPANGYGIQAAIDSLPATGGEIYIPAGTYEVDTTIVIPNKMVYLEGDAIGWQGDQPNGSGTFLKLKNGANCDMFSYGSLTHTFFGGMKYLGLSGNDTNQTSVSNGITISGYYTDMSFDHIMVSYFNGNNINITSGHLWNIMVTHSWLEYATGSQLYVSAPYYSSTAFVYWLKFMDNFIGAVGGTYGIYIKNTQDCNISDNIIYNPNQDGIHITSVQGLVLKGNIIENASAGSSNTYDGINITDSGGTASKYILISNNKAANVRGTSTERYGLSINSLSDYITATNNEFNVNLTGSILQSATNSHGIVNDNTASILTFSKSISAPSISSAGSITGNTLVSTVAIGTAPITVASSTLVTNLNANFLGGNTFTTIEAASLPIGGGTLTGALNINSTTGSTSYVRVQVSGANVGILGSLASEIGSSPNNMGAYVYGANKFVILTNGLRRFSESGTGHATFGDTTDDGVHTVQVIGTENITSTLNVGGADTVIGNMVMKGTDTVTGATDLKSTLNVVGNATFIGNIAAISTTCDSIISLSGNISFPVNTSQELHTITFTSAATATFSVGTTSGGTDVIATVTCTAGNPNTQVINKVYSVTGQQTIFITILTGGAGTNRYDVRRF